MNDLNKLYRVKCYLFGGMQYMDGSSWRRKIQQNLASLKILFIDPYNKPLENGIQESEEDRIRWKKMIEEGKYEEVASIVKKLRHEDLRFCDSADFAIGQINPVIPSWGSAEEFFWLNRMKKPIHIFVEGGKKNCPLWIFGTIPHKYIFNNMEELENYIIKLDSGEEPMSPERWALYRKDYR